MRRSISYSSGIVFLLIYYNVTNLLWFLVFGFWIPFCVTVFLWLNFKVRSELQYDYYSNFSAY